MKELILLTLIIMLTKNAQAQDIKDMDLFINELSYTNGDAPECPSKEVYEVIERAKTTNETAKAFIGFHAFSSICKFVKKDEVKGKAIFNAAVKNKNPYALHALSYMYYNQPKLLGILGLPPKINHKKYVKYIEESAELGWFKAQALLIGSYFHGVYPKVDDYGYVSSIKNPEKGLKYLKKYADQGNVSLKAKLGIGLLNGYPYKGGIPNYQDAFSLLSEVFDRDIDAPYGDINIAKVELAKIYARGYLIKRDYNRALDILEKHNYRLAKDIDTSRYFGMMSECKNTATTYFLGVQLACTNREEFRSAIKAMKGIVNREDKNYYSDVYDPSLMIEGAIELTVGYTHDNELSKVTYKIKTNQFTKIHNMIKDKYKGREGSKGYKIDNVHTWTTKDYIKIEIDNRFSNAVLLSYTHPTNQDHQTFVIDYNKRVKNHKQSIIDRKKHDEKYARKNAELNAL
jgi:uncharacterized protein YqgQ